jgi:hypothetical protein
MGSMLQTYLQDHHAGSTAGLELARRTARANEGTEYGPELLSVADEIAEDRETLERVMEHFDVSPNRIKDGGAWALEKVGRLKPNNSILSYSPLSRVVELEGLVTGVTGKLALWEALRASIGEGVAGVEFAPLSARAEAQRERLDALRRRAAVEAFGSSGQPT